MCIVAYYNYWHCSVFYFFSSFYVCLYVRSVSVLFIMGKPKIISIFRNYKFLFFIEHIVNCRLLDGLLQFLEFVLLQCTQSVYFGLILWAMMQSLCIKINGNA